MWLGPFACLLAGAYAAAVFFVPCALMARAEAESDMAAALNLAARKVSE